MADRSMLAFIDLLRSIFPRGPRTSRPVGAPNFRNDGFDQDRLDAAHAKRERRRQRNLDQVRRG